MANNKYIKDRISDEFDVFLIRSHEYSARRRKERKKNRICYCEEGIYWWFFFYLILFSLVWDIDREKESEKSQFTHI